MPFCLSYIASFLYYYAVLERKLTQLIIVCHICLEVPHLTGYNSSELTVLQVMLCDFSQDYVAFTVQYTWQLLHAIWYNLLG